MGRFKKTFGVLVEIFFFLFVLGVFIFSLYKIASITGLLDKFF